MSANRYLALHVLVTAVVVVGCSAPPAASPPVDPAAVRPSPTAGAVAGPDVTSATVEPDPAVAFSTADVEFLVTMVAHHTAALQMLELGEQRAATPDVRRFTSETRSAQQLEVDRMRRCLASLGVDPAATGTHNHSGSSPQDVAELRELSGSAFDRRLLDALTSHSIVASTLANAAAKDGFNRGVRQLASEMVAREWAELETIRRLDRS